jgi:hypothetical protein
MKPLLLKLLSFLLPAGVAVGFLLWWFSPTQALTRTSKAFFETFEVRRLSLDNKEELTERLKAVLAPTVEVLGPDPIPNDTLSQEELLDYHQRLQGFLISSRITTNDYSVHFPSSNEAIVVAQAHADLQFAGGQRRVMRYQITLHYAKSGKTWLLTQIQALTR